MFDLNWMPAGLPGVTDFVDEAGTIFGYVQPIAASVRAYVTEYRPGKKVTFASVTDHPTDEAARAHVEAEVARLYGARE